MTAAELTRAMLARGLTRASLATELGVSLECVKSWTYGRRPVGGCCRHMLAALELALYGELPDYNDRQRQLDQYGFDIHNDLAEARRHR